MEFINWSSDTQKVIENDEKEFHSLLGVGAEDNAVNKADFNDDNFSVSSQQSQHPHRLDVSWGRYFAQRSPPMGDLGGSHGIYPRPTFIASSSEIQLLSAAKISTASSSDREMAKQPQVFLVQHHDVSSIQEEKEPEEADESDMKQQHHQKQCAQPDKRDTEMKLDEESVHQLSNGKASEQPANNPLTPADLECDGEHQDEHEHEVLMMHCNHHDDISIAKSLEQLNMEELAAQYLSNRDSNSTLKSDKSTDSQRSNNKFIQIAKKIKHIQRFYQFTIASQGQQGSHPNDDDDEVKVEKQIEAIMLQYIASVNQSKQKAQLSAVTYQANSKRCTVLILFEREANEPDTEDWTKQFLSFPAVSKLMDKSSAPYFTQLSS